MVFSSEPIGPVVRVGYGEDAHRLAAGHSLILGGIAVPDAALGTVAHSDGDAVLHAVADALLSGVALGDIGDYFPDTDPLWAGLDSRAILGRVLELVRERGYTPVNIALVVTMDKPRLGPLRAQIARNVAALLGLSESEVGVSFKTSEGLAPAHVQTRVTALLTQLQD
ncbi:2-C-methyl-D-erythritol 2,4-cyclodiphosphate synthase [Deinococcus radiopugnans]|uniref:2-C-methyl-D-erythritol 2,4-cyclodiphosphate synthase n=1 Tax=Deinococcus radiopugnans ATCC 19172 TaxID=585398 RepID=A0A5C4XVH2_9DEIO|nr:2-C-methyl-D-erythritol 2,4-cyclodiphosphate synthase [Deinococcus radiopugnans]MBB6018613.1 2-C-methyl-D-erythritol 2,4-cyclodiphosphate synthase [Deinococcus radiopugnans ATCC 19172]TNM67238.1 2-C-methyl-D-erythritol 2,4-cyclodiphosphate synthase [Deinococcus radiopugnans ATCC 19172]